MAKSNTKVSLLVIFLLILITILAIGIYFTLNPFSKFKQIGTLSDRFTDTPTMLRDMVNPNEELALNERLLLSDEPLVWVDEKPEENDNYLFEIEIYCANNIQSKIEKISALTNVYDYRADTDIVTLEDFKIYLSQNHASCIVVSPLDNKRLHPNITKTLEWDENVEKMGIWVKKFEN
jgi:hypothetical protein